MLNFHCKKLQGAMSLVLIALIFSGCGFKLRGNYLLAPELQTLVVSSVDKHGELTRFLKEHLTLNQVTLLKASSEKVPEIRVLKDTLDRRTLSVFPNGQVAEYELIYTVRYQLLLVERELQEFSFELNRDYLNDPDIALAKSRELALIVKEIRQEAASKILRDLASIKL